jgi:hypothetical protein
MQGSMNKGYKQVQFGCRPHPNMGGIVTQTDRLSGILHPGIITEGMKESLCVL